MPLVVSLGTVFALVGIVLFALSQGEGLPDKKSSTKSASSKKKGVTKSNKDDDSGDQQTTSRDIAALPPPPFRSATDVSGRYLQVEVTLGTSEGALAPVLRGVSAIADQL